MLEGSRLTSASWRTWRFNLTALPTELLLENGTMAYTPTAEEDRVAAVIVDAGYQVHKALGPGLLESAYEECLAYELAEQGLSVRRQVGMPITYKAMKLDAGYRLDLIVQSLVVVEVKAVENLLPIHQAQLLTYLRLSACRVGFLMNFTVPVIKSGIRRIIL
jgi:GxxExxY protein